MQTNWDSDSDDDNSSEREELPTVIRVEKKVDVLTSDCVTVVNVASPCVCLCVYMCVCMYCMCVCVLVCLFSC